MAQAQSRHTYRILPSEPVVNRKNAEGAEPGHSIQRLMADVINSDSLAK